MIRSEIESIIENVCRELYPEATARVVLSRTDEQFGDYATNIAMQLAKQIGRSPKDIAQEIIDALQSNLIASAELAGPGFINITLTDSSLVGLAALEIPKLLTNEKIVIEYSCPNAFKELHTGHLYQTVVGDMLARLLENAGAVVSRTSFGGDVGLHVARCMWGILGSLGGENPENLKSIPDSPFDRSAWLSQCYVRGAGVDTEDNPAHEEIVALNKRIYELHDKLDKTSDFARIYWQCRQWSYDYFESFYDMIGVDEMRYYPESETTGRGMEMVEKQLLAGNLKRSDGAVVFEGDKTKHLHTRVFVTSAGLPTYETKDIGVILAERSDYAFDRRILITGNDQKEYMRVVFAAMEQFVPELKGKMTHLTNGTVRFGDGSKMSSRLGNVSRAIDVLSAVREKVVSVVEQSEDVTLIDQVTLGAIKYEFAKYRLGGDISFDIDESVSLHGNSGPYLQYAYARARSILRKSPQSFDNVLFEDAVKASGLEPAERSLLRKISEYSEVTGKSASELMPHYICTYLYELAQDFNRFYEHNRVIDHERQNIRLLLVDRYTTVLKSGLEILGIHAPEKM